jgi:N-acetylglucosamine-6-sulfatase
MSTMNRRAFLGNAAAAAVAAGALATGDACLTSRAPLRRLGGRRDRRPNVVVILTDDQRADCLSLAGHSFLKTPHIDRIGREGVHFANAFVTTSLCSPSRATFLSGLYAHTHQVLNNFTEYPADLPSYPRSLKEAGYETAYIGKWHMGEENDEARPGFDYWASHKGQGKYFDNTFNINGKRQDLEGYYTHRVTELATDWLRRPHPRPFLLIFGHKAPHGPFQPEPKYASVFDSIEIKRPPTAGDTGAGKPAWVRESLKTWHGIDGPLYEIYDYTKFVRAYLGTILSVDDSVGAVYDALRATGELDNTVLLFTSDNGFLLGEHGRIDKRCMYEESIRIPMVVRYPELVREPRTVSQMVLNADLAPSLLDLCGARPLPRVHGLSWKRLVQGDPSGWRKSWYYEYNFEAQFPYTPNVRGVRTDEWKFVHYPNGDGSDQYAAELYDLVTDPRETRNLVPERAYASVAGALRAELDRLKVETGGLPDRMPFRPELKMEMPEKSIR